MDYIAGTSMGGLVGALYAMGMSPEEMRKLVVSLDWPNLLAGETPYRALSYRRKEDRRDYPNSMVVGLKKGVGLASGLNSGSRVLLGKILGTIIQLREDSGSDQSRDAQQPSSIPITRHRREASHQTRDI